MDPGGDSKGLPGAAVGLHWTGQWEGRRGSHDRGSGTNGKSSLMGETDLGDCRVSSSPKTLMNKLE